MKRFPTQPLIPNNNIVLQQHYNPEFSDRDNCLKEDIKFQGWLNWEMAYTHSQFFMSLKYAWAAGVREQWAVRNRNGRNGADR